MTVAFTRQPHDVNGLSRLGGICFTVATVAWTRLIDAERAAAALKELVFPGAHLFKVVSLASSRIEWLTFVWDDLRQI